MAAFFPSRPHAAVASSPRAAATPLRHGRAMCPATMRSATSIVAADRTIPLHAHPCCYGSFIIFTRSSVALSPPCGHSRFPHLQLSPLPPSLDRPHACPSRVPYRLPIVFLLWCFQFLCLLSLSHFLLNL
ncbi:hypothetical protein SESBI_31432 [Sesbania bispinosa]|nr:hypothetical protein SESBI_31432 [Sesbania bispinosa]